MIRFFYFVNFLFLIAVMIYFVLGVFSVVNIAEASWKYWILYFMAHGFLTQFLLLQKNYSQKYMESKEVKQAYRYEIEKNEKFRKEVQKVFKTHLKVSILFWMLYYRKEKMKPFHDAKRDIFKSLNREFSSVSWMHDLLGSLDKDLEKYNRS